MIYIDIHIQNRGLAIGLLIRLSGSAENGVMKKIASSGECIYLNLQRMFEEMIYYKR